MAEESFLTPELESRVGVAGEPQQVALSRELVRRVCDALGAPVDASEERAPHAVLLGLESAVPRTAIEGLPGMSLITGQDWEWRRRLRVGEVLTGVGSMVEARERVGGRLGHTLFVTHQVVYSGADGAEAAVVRTSSAYFDPAERPQREEAPPAPPAAPAPAEVPLRQAGPGDGLPGRTLTAGTARVVRYMGAAWVFERFFYDDAVARAAGLPGAIVPGPLKLGLMTQWLEEIAGDGGFLRSLRAAYRRPDTHDLALTFGGMVTDVEQTDEGRRLTCEVWIEREGARSLAGLASVDLRSD
jgi:hypothetical protein